MNKPNDKQTIRQLTDRFFDGLTTLEEEQQLYKYYAQDSIDPELRPYKEMFEDLAAIALPQAERPSATHQPTHRRPLITVLRLLSAAAATITLLIGVVTAVNYPHSEALADLYGGSYMIVNGQRIDDLRRIHNHIEGTLRQADNIERRLDSHSIDDVEQKLIDNVGNEQMKNEIIRMLND